MLDNVLEVDQASASAYRTLALLQIVTTDDNLRDLAQAAEDLDVADDFGLTHRNHAVRALLEQANGKSSAAQQALNQAIRRFIQRWFRSR